MSMFPSPVTPERIEEIRDKHRRLLSSPSYRRNLAACWYHDDIRDLLSALSASQAALAAQGQAQRDLLVSADSMLSAAAYGRAVTKDEMLALSSRIRKAYERGELGRSWQPIATAPRDEQTPILLWTPHTMAVGYFDNGEWWIIGSKYVIEATHWMPLPAVPGAGAGEKP